MAWKLNKSPFSVLNWTFFLGFKLQYFFTRQPNLTKLDYCISLNSVHNFLIVLSGNTSNVLNSGTLLSATPKIGSEGVVPLLFIKRSFAGVPLIFLRGAKIWAALFFHSFFLKSYFFWHSFSVNKPVSPSLLWFIYSWKQRYF